MSKDFTGFKLGTVTQAFAEFTDGSDININSEFCKIIFERENYLCLSNRKPVAIRFSDPKLMRELRSRCRAREGTGCPLIKVSSAVNKNICLDFMFPAMTLDIQGEIPILLEKKIVEELICIDDAEARINLLNNLVLTVGPFDNDHDNARAEKYLIRISPDFLAEDAKEQANIVKILIKTGKIIDCRLEKNTKDIPFLHATSHSGNEESDKRDEFRRIHIIRFNGSFKVINTPEEASNNQSEKLAVPSSSIMRAWAYYYQILNEEKHRKLKHRIGKNILFSDPLNSTKKGNFDITIQNWNVVQDAWTDEDELDKEENEFTIDSDVEIREINASDSGEIQQITNSNPRVIISGKPAWLLTVSKRQVARLAQGTIKMRNSNDLPPDKGEIVAVGSNDSQNKRKKDAVVKLQTGDAALPDLLDILNDPSTCKPASRRMYGSGNANFNSVQLEAIARALGNINIVAVQGPPGTGKTKVIVEVVKRFLAKREKDSEPARVLISSTQNIAVQNAVDKLRKDGVIIHLIQSKTYKEKSGEDNLFDFTKESDNICEAVQANLRGNISLYRNFEAFKLLDDCENRLTWSDSISEIHEFLLNIINPKGEYLPPLIYELIPTLISEANYFIIRIQQLESKNPIDESVNYKFIELAQQLKDLFMMLVDNEDLQNTDIISKYLEENKQEYSADFMWIAERAGDLCRKYKMASRKNNLPEIISFIKEFISEIEKEIHDQSICSDIKSELIKNEFYADIKNWCNRIIMLIRKHKEYLWHTKAGVLARWRQSLKGDPNIWNTIHKKYSQVTGATCQMSTQGKNDYYDYVVIDEAARSDVFELLIPMMSGKKILLVGDQLQLPPMVEHDIVKRIEEENEQFNSCWFKGNTLFTELFDSLPEENKIMLNIQYRSHPVIGNAVSRAFYRGELYSGSETTFGIKYTEWLKSKIPYWNIFDNHPMVWIDYESYIPNNDDYCSNNETELTLKLIKLFISAEKTKENEYTKLIGVITFYSAQMEHINKRLNVDSEFKDYVDCGTVDSFQGKEYPVVILCCSRHNQAGKVGFMNLPNRVNVAVSRAQRQLIIIGYKSTILNEKTGQGSQPFKDFVHAAGENLITKSEIEEL